MRCIHNFVGWMLITVGSPWLVACGNDDSAPTGGSSAVAGAAGSVNAAGAPNAAGVAGTSNEAAAAGSAAGGSGSTETGGTNAAGRPGTEAGGAAAAGGSGNAGNGGATATGGSSNLAGASGSVPGAGGQPQSGTAVLQSLGVNTKLGPRLDPANVAVRDGYNPARMQVTQVAKHSEIFVAGLHGQAANAGWTPNGKLHALLDWPKLDSTDFVSSNSSENDTWMAGAWKTATSGDIDGDGIDEIMVAYFATSTDPNNDRDLILKAMKRNSDGTLTSVKGAEKILLDPYKLSDTTNDYPDDYWRMNNFNATVGDLDGNGQNETVIAFNGSVYVVGDASKDFAVLGGVKYAGTDWRRLLKIATGDLDNDGRDELVVSEGRISKADAFQGTALYHIYKLSGGLREIASGTISDTKGMTTATLRAASCAVGDLDADGINEVVFAGHTAGTAKTYYALVLEPEWDKDLGKFTFSFLGDFATVEGRYAEHITPMCAIADFAGGGKKQLLVHNAIFQNLSNTGRAFTPSVRDIYAPTNAPYLGSAWDCSLAVGDVDGDTVADIAYLSDGFYELYTVGFANGKWVRKGSGDIDNTGANYPYVTMGDYDGDSFTLQFVGSEVLFSDPHPIAVLAGNPYFEQFDMDGETSFGTTMSKDTSVGDTIGFSVGRTFGYENDELFGLFKAEFEVSFEASFDWTTTQSTSIEESYAYSTVSEDQIVFTTVPYDVYYYKVIQAPDRKAVGQTITVNVPRKPITLPVERNFYNAHNGSAPDIDETVLSHKLGDPYSYPSSAQADALIVAGGGQGLKSSQVMSVGGGSGATQINMSKSNGLAKGQEFDMSVEVSASVGVGGFKAGTSVGFHYGESYEITTTKGTTFGGAVGNIPVKDYSPDKSFSWGLFTYRKQLRNDQFIVVQYFTEGS